MGVQITELLTKKEIDLKQLSGKVIACDAPLFLYQFLTSIRQSDGSPLTNSRGEVTSHLVGLFSRTTKLMQKGLKLAYVFDGKVPELKKKERERRKELKQEAAIRYEEAKEAEDTEGMRKFGARTARLTAEMIAEAQELLHALGIPVVTGASEGEAQASYIVSKGDAYAVASQDSDSLMFNADRLVRNLSLSGRRKMPGKLASEFVAPELVILSENLNTLGIDREQFIALAMLVGTDYNCGGVKGIGPKNALKLVKQFGTDFGGLFSQAEWGKHCENPWEDIFNLIKEMPVTDHYTLEWKPVNEKRLISLLVDKHEFSTARVNASIEKLLEEKEKKQQKGLGEYF